MLVLGTEYGVLGDGFVLACVRSTEGLDGAYDCLTDCSEQAIAENQPEL